MIDPINDRLMLNLIIQRIPGLAVPERNLLSQMFKSTADFTRLSKEDIEQIIKRHLSKWSIKKYIVLAENDYKTSLKKGINIVMFSDSDYPPLLREIYDPPMLLFYRGVLPNPELPLVAMVGTRKPSPSGAAKAYEMGKDFGSFGIPVVSGLALGIDAYSHRGNVDAGAPSVAVLGSGLDQVYPSSNRLLAQRILKNNGVLISEYPPQMEPRRWHFPARNRIISALARGTVIVEAPIKSGALITADFALQQNRDLWVCSCGISSKKESGTARLAQDGAKVIEKAEEILKEWNMNKHTYINCKRNINGNNEFIYNNGSSRGSDLALSLARTLEIEV